MGEELDTVYVVINEGEAVFASEDMEKAEAFADYKNNAGIEAAARGMDLDEDDDRSDAAIQAGFDGDYYEVGIASLKGITDEDSMVTVRLQSSEAEVEYSEIVNLLETNKDDEDDNCEDDFS